MCFCGKKKESEKKDPVLVVKEYKMTAKDK